MKEVTSLEALKSYSNGEVVELPAFGNNMPFVARLRKPSMIALAKSGKIPNTLLSSASTLFSDTSGDKPSDSNISEFYDILVSVAEACLIEPTYKNIVDSGLMLNDAQLMAIFNFSQSEVKELDSFREE